MLFGTEAEVSERLQWLASVGVTDVAAMVNFGGLSEREVEGTVDGLARCAPKGDPPTPNVAPTVPVPTGARHFGVPPGGRSAAKGGGSGGVLARSRE
jgi:hypothetical protein